MACFHIPSVTCENCAHLAKGSAKGVWVETTLTGTSHFYPRSADLFERVVAQRDALQEEAGRLRRLMQQAEKERDEARAEVARLREALRSCADIGEARVAKVVRDALTQDFEKPGDSVVTAGDLIGLRRA